MYLSKKELELIDMYANVLIGHGGMEEEQAIEIATKVAKLTREIIEATIRLYNTIKEIFIYLYNKLSKMQYRELPKPSKYMPVKIESPPMPDIPPINIPNIRSNI